MWGAVEASLGIAGLDLMAGACSIAPARERALGQPQTSDMVSSGARGILGWAVSLQVDLAQQSSWSGWAGLWGASAGSDAPVGLTRGPGQGRGSSEGWRGAVRPRNALRTLTI